MQLCTRYDWPIAGSFGLKSILAAPGSATGLVLDIGPDTTLSIAQDLTVTNAERLTLGTGATLNVGGPWPFSESSCGPAGVDG